MDPAGLLPIIAETIKATYLVGITFDNLIHATLTGAITITPLETELEGARNTIISIQSCLESTAFLRNRPATVDDPLPQLLSSSSALLLGFQELLTRIHGSLGKVNALRKGNIVQRAAKELRKKTNFKGGEDEPARFLEQLSAYKQNFQLALQTITIYLTVYNQVSNSSDLAGRIDALLQDITALDPDGTYPATVVDSEGSVVLGSDASSVKSITSDFSETGIPLRPAGKSSVITWLDAASNPAPEREDDSGPETEDFGNEFRTKSRGDDSAGIDADGDSRAKMRLLNTTTLQLHEFFGREIPYYAILSHRWGVDEVTFQDLQKDRKNMETAGWEKIVGCCAQARREGWEYVWIDSCCIDKTSSAELSEAINSMFQWYENAQVCYAYLNDVPAEEQTHERAGSAFRNSSWFTRGWTLQELLAPQTVFFFNRNWVEIGTKCNFDELIASVTGIDEQFLEGDFERASIAQKFSWASKRQTLRVEDMAYCLMGLFGVNMPLLYGEGTKAFIRLQLEIMKVSDDDSLFAWTDWSTRATPSQTTGLLANSPAAFQNSGDIVSFAGGHKAITPHLMTNRGLSISLVLVPADEAWSRGVQSDRSQVIPHIPESSQFFAPLSCSISKEHGGIFLIMLRLAHVTDDKGHRRYARLCSTSLHLLPSTSPFPESLQEQQIFVLQTPYLATTKHSGRTLKVAIHAKPFSRPNVDYWVSSVHSGKLTSGRGNWYQPVEAGYEINPIIRLGANKNDSEALVEFADDTGSHSGKGEKFVLHIYQNIKDRRTVGINLLNSSNTSLHKVDERLLVMREGDEPVSRRDRATVRLPSGRIVIAALRKRAQDGELMYAVDFENRPPPPQMSDEELLNQFLETNRMVSES